MPVGSDAASKKPNRDATDAGSQSVLVSASRCRQQHRLAGKCGGFDQVEEMLEETGIAALVNRAAHDQRVGRDKAIDQRLRLGREIGLLPRLTKRGPEIVKVMQADRGAELCRDPAGDSPDQGVCPGRCPRLPDIPNSCCDIAWSLNLYGCCRV